MDKKIIVGSEGMGSWADLIVNYVLKLAYPDYEIKWQNTPNCHIIIRSHFQNHERDWCPIKKPYINWSGEVYNVTEKKYPPICNFYSNKNNISDNFNIPFALFTLGHRTTDQVRDRMYKNDPKNPRPYMIAFCNSAPRPHRIEFFMKLKMRDKNNVVHGLGECCNTVGKKVPGCWNGDELIKTYSQYKFILALENTVEPGYITEKILNAFLAGGIPVYYGDSKMAKELFNPKAFICTDDFENFDACADYIFNLTDNEINKMMAEPVFKENVVPDLFRINDFDNPPQFYKDIANHIKEHVPLEKII